MVRSSVRTPRLPTTLVLASCVFFSPLATLDPNTLAHSPPRDAPAFVNIAPTCGLETPAKRVVLGDLDGDGWLDVIADASRVLLNRRAPDGDGRIFVDHTFASGLLRRPNHITGTTDDDAAPDIVILGDVDGDGDLDLFTGIRNRPEHWKRDDETGEPAVDDAGNRISSVPDRGWRNEIHRNDGTGRFTVTPDAGVSDAIDDTICATFLDFDLDGVLDLAVGNWYRSYGWSLEGHPDRLYRGRGDGTFEEVTERAGLLGPSEPGTHAARKPTMGIAAGDLDGDRLPDIFICSYGRRWNQLWRNRGDGTFEEIGERTGFDGDAERSGTYPGNRRAAEEPFRANGNTFDVALADFDDDGDLDAFLGEITHAWAGDSSDRSMLLENRGLAQGHRFARRTDVGIDRTHDVERWNQGDLYGGWFDGNGDGRQDLLIASGDYPDEQRLRVWEQTPAHTFVERTVDWSIDWPSSGQPTVGDIDRDGDPDLLVGRSLFRLSRERREEIGGAPALLENRIGDAAHWATIFVRGRGRGGCNTQGIGCRVIIEAGEARRERSVQSASGHVGRQNPAELLVGLDDAAAIDRLTIEWANAARTTTVIEDLPADARITVFEPAPGEPTRVEWEPLRR